MCVCKWENKVEKKNKKTSTSEQKKRFIDCQDFDVNFDVNFDMRIKQLGAKKKKNQMH